MDIKITINAPDLAAAIQSLADAIVAAGCAPVDVSPVKDVEITPEVIEELELEEAPAEEEEAEDSDKELTLEEVRAAFVAKNTPKNREKLKNILAEFKVKKVTDLKEKDFTKVMEKLEAV